MTWSDILQDWQGQTDRLHRLFPYTDPAALARFRGNRHLLAEYIADTHDLTQAEGMEAIEMRLMAGVAQGRDVGLLCAAE